MTNIYVVAGARNIRLSKHEGELIVNIGQTSRTCSERMSDNDYSRKAAGGEWQTILWYENFSGTDRQLHEVLLSNFKGLVSKTNMKSNREEFSFRCNSIEAVENIVKAAINLFEQQKEPARDSSDIRESFENENYDYLIRNFDLLNPEAKDGKLRYGFKVRKLINLPVVTYSGPTSENKAGIKGYITKSSLKKLGIDHENDFPQINDIGASTRCHAGNYKLACLSKEQTAFILDTIVNTFKSHFQRKQS